MLRNLRLNYNFNLAGRNMGLYGEIKFIWRILINIKFNNLRFPN